MVKNDAKLFRSPLDVTAAPKKQLLMLDKLAKWLGVVGALLTLGGAFETFTNAALHWRLLVACIACFCLSWALAGVLASWMKPQQEVGFGKAPANRSTLKTLGLTVVLGIIGGAFVWISWCLLIDRTTFQIEETKATGKSTALLIAPYSTVKSVTVELPNGNCDWSDKTPNRVPRLQLVALDLNSPTPILLISNFEYPQRIEVACSGADAIRNVTADPSSTGIYRAEELNWWRILSIIMGGVIWLIAGLRLWVSSR
jgi:hypothetical protein